MIRRPPRSTRPDTPFPYTTLFRSQGLAGDLAATLLLATDKPVLVAPAMNHRMWHHPATQANLAALEARGVRRVGPTEGAMARSEEHTSELQSLMRISYAVFCLKKKNKTSNEQNTRLTSVQKT